MVLRTSKVYATFWYLAAERQRIFFNKLRGLPATLDPILQEYKFTNAYRAADRVSQYLIQQVLYGEPSAAQDLFLRATLFRLFNKIETWQLLEHAFETIGCETFDTVAYGETLERAIAKGARIYSSAYIMPSGKSAFGSARKHQNHLALIELMLKDDAPAKIADAPNMRSVYELLLSYPTLGPFLAFQLTIDLNYSELIDFSEMDFVVAGPGAQSGIRKCFADVGDWSAADVIRYATEHQKREFERFNEDFLSLWGRPLQLIDVQNLFCEVDKYARVAHPEITGIGNRKRIKRRYSPSLDGLDYWFPPKWGINQKVQRAAA